MTWLDDHDHLDRHLVDKGADADLESAIEMAELDLGDVTMADAVVKLRQIGRVHGSCLNCLRQLARWLEAMNTPRSPNIMSLHNAALAAASEAEIKQAEAERTATATAAERRAAEKAAIAAHEEAKKAQIAFEAKRAEEMAAAAAAAAGNLQVNSDS